MSFQSRVVAIAERFLGERTFELVVAPALADLEFDPGATPPARLANRLAVVRALGGALATELGRDSLSFITLTMVPTCYYVCLMALCFDAFHSWTQVFGVTGAVAGMFLVPVGICFWPARRPMRSSR